MADTQARRLAELSAATGESADAIASGRGWSLDQLAADLALDREGLNAYLEQLASQFEADSIGLAAIDITAAIQQLGRDLVAPWRDDAMYGTKPLLRDDSGEKPGDYTKPALDPYSGKRVVMAAPVSDDSPTLRALEEVRRELAAQRAIIEQLLPQLVDAAEAGVDATNANTVAVDKVEVAVRRTTGGKTGARNERERV